MPSLTTSRPCSGGRTNPALEQRGFDRGLIIAEDVEVVRSATFTILHNQKGQRQELLHFLPAAPGFFSRPPALPTQPKGAPLCSLSLHQDFLAPPLPLSVSAFLRAATKPCAVLLPGEKRRGRIGRELFRGGPSASVRSAALAAAPSPQGKGWLVSFLGHFDDSHLGLVWEHGGR